jgi:hypothetical protein
MNADKLKGKWMQFKVTSNSLVRERYGEKKGELLKWADQ